MNMGNAKAAPSRGTLGESEWINCATAARILEVDRKHIYKFARDGLLVTRHLPGVATRYQRASVLRLARESVRPASSSASASASAIAQG